MVIRIPGVDPRQVDPASLRANGQSAQRTKAKKDRFVARFDRDAVQDLGNSRGELAIEGRLMDGRAFRGTGILRIRPAHGRDDEDDEDEWR